MYVSFLHVPIGLESKVCVFEHGPKPKVVKRQRAMKREIYAVFFESKGMVKAVELKEQKTVTAMSYNTKYFSESLQKVNVRGLMVYHYGASSHTAR